MSFNEYFEKLPTNTSFKWSVPIMDKDKCRRSTGINFGTFKRLANGLESNPKLFADNTSLLSTVHDITTSTVSLYHDLSKISECAVQWKINFNPDPCKQARGSRVTI